MARGKPANLTEYQIRQAQDKAQSAAHAARLLGVSYNTYRKYAEKFGVFGRAKNPDGVGIRKGYKLDKGDYNLEDVLAGKYPNYPISRLKDRLVEYGIFEEVCDNCGFDEQRIIDYRVPLKLDFIDGDKQNYDLENLRLLCYNCYFLQVGNLEGAQHVYYGIDGRNDIGVGSEEVAMTQEEVKEYRERLQDLNVEEDIYGSK